MLLLLLTLPALSSLPAAQAESIGPQPGRMLATGVSAKPEYPAAAADPCLPVATVDTTADAGAGSLRQAIFDVCAGGRVDFNATVFSTAQTISVTSATLTLDKALTIDGAANGVVTPTIRGPGSDCTTCFRVLTVNASASVTPHRLAITAGNDAEELAGGILNAGILTVTQSAIYSDSEPTHSTGGILQFGAGSRLYLGDSAIHHNDGDGVTANSGILMLVHSSIHDNRGAGIPLRTFTAQITHLGAFAFFSGTRMRLPLIVNDVPPETPPEPPSEPLPESTPAPTPLPDEGQPAETPTAVAG